MDVPKPHTDYSGVVQGLEAEQRHDLAVHLYSAFLSHRVDPLFPAEKWANWPDRRQLPLDPRVREDYEDARDHYGQAPGPDASQAAGDAPDGTECTDPDSKLRFSRPTTGVTVHFKHRTTTSARAVLVHELSVLLSQKIRRKMAQRGLGHDRSVDLDSSPVVHHMATQMATRLAAALARANKLRRRQHPKKSKDPSIKTWQDIHIGAITGNEPDLASIRRSYEKCRRLFHNAGYKYEYDGAFYEGRAPAFDVGQHLSALNRKSALDPEELLDARQRDSAFKENVFCRLWDAAAQARQLLPDSESQFEPKEGPFMAERRKVFGSGISEKDYLL